MVKVDFNKLPDFPTTQPIVGLICKTAPHGYPENWLWEFQPAPRARVWVEVKIAAWDQFQELAKRKPVEQVKDLPRAPRRPYFLISCKRQGELSRAREALGDSLESEAVQVAPHVWIEAEPGYTWDFLAWSAED